MLTKGFFLTLLITFSVNTVIFSQRTQPWENPDYGPDSTSRIECAHNLSTMSEFMRINLPDYAISSWRRVFEICPSSSKNIYILGARIFTHKIENEQDPELRQSYLDTLMMLYDKRIEYFGEEGVVLGRKAMDMIKYIGEDAYKDAYSLFKESAVITGDEADVNVLIGLSESGFALFRSGDIPVAEFLEDYLFLSDIIEKQLQNTRLRSRANTAKEVVESNLDAAGVSDCNYIEQAFSERIKASPEDEKLINTVANMLKSGDCVQEEFYRIVFLNIFNRDKTAENAAEISRHYIRNDDYESALQYILQSYELEENNERKAQYALQASVIYFTRLNKSKEAAEYALIAINLRPDWADPYFALAPAYIEGMRECTSDNFERLTVYWLAVDLMETAARLDPSSATRARNQINEYKRYYPPKEEAFFRSIQEGSTYNIGCWIRRSTTVRFN